MAKRKTESSSKAKPKIDTFSNVMDEQYIFGTCEIFSIFFFFFLLNFVHYLSQVIEHKNNLMRNNSILFKLRDS